jgi:hypothetical protein
MGYGCWEGLVEVEVDDAVDLGAWGVALVGGWD